MSYTVFHNRDCYRNYNYVEHYGFPSHYTLEQMIDIAQQHAATGIVKNGKGKWYLRNQPRHDLISRLTSSNIKDYTNVTFYLL
jgi:hypothetical protein